MAMSLSDIHQTDGLGAPLTLEMEGGTGHDGSICLTQSSVWAGGG